MNLSESITLTGEQQESHDLLLTFGTADNTAYNYASFTGYAGTGKTTTLTELIKSLDPTKLNIGVAAPTHKAVKVIKQNKIDGVDYRTVHSWLKLKETINFDTGEITYVEDTYQKDVQPPIADMDILIVDESSMLAQDLFVRLGHWRKRTGLRLIFTGDPAQIPPVKEKMSIAFAKADEWGALSVGLTKVMRQKEGNPILEFATEIRDNLSAKVLIPRQHTIPENVEFSAGTEWAGITLLEENSIEEQQILEYFFNAPEFKQNSDYMKVVAWRNSTVRKYNERVRAILYRDEKFLPDYMEGEKLMMQDPYPVSARDILSRNEELEVLSLSISAKRYTYVDEWNGLATENFKCYNATIKYWYNGYEKRAMIPILHEDSSGTYNSLLNKLSQMAKTAGYESRKTHWKNFYKLKETFANVTYNYAITGHKSQGSSYDQCLVLKWDIDTNPNVEERNRILYVACSRPRHRLFIEP
jgi:ATP-dependent exoDNAse (exonuclease V) alpha subunit